MNRSHTPLPRATSVLQNSLASLRAQSERSMMLAIVMLASACSAALGYVLAQYYSVDVLTSVTFFAEDCWGNWDTKIGRHCFGDYAMLVGAGMRPNPWEPYFLLPPHQPFVVGGPASAMLPALLFAIPAKLLGVPAAGMIGYLCALTIAVFAPAIWAARGAVGLERVVVFLALGPAAVPAWMVIDRGNSAGFAVPIALIYFLALSRQRWALVAVTVVLAALIKPQFAVLVIALFAARQWRIGLAGLGGVAISNLATYLLWPRNFPETIEQSLHNLSVTSSSFTMLVDARNVAFSRAVLLIPDTIKLHEFGGKLPDNYLAGPRSLIGYAFLIIFTAAMLVLGTRIPPVMVGIVLLATGALSPPLALFYHLVFVLPIAALVLRAPQCRAAIGLFDQYAKDGDRRRGVGVSVGLAAALSIISIPMPAAVTEAAIPGIGTHLLVGTTTFLAPFLWLIACFTIIISYARNPAQIPSEGRRPAGGTNASPTMPANVYAD